MRDVTIGQVDYTVLVKIIGTDGAPETGLTNADIDIAYSRVETDNDVTTSDVTPASLASLTAAHSDWGFLEISSGDHPGLYRLDIADAVFASGAWEAVVTITDASGTDFYAVDIGFRLVSFNVQDGVRLGLTALPNAAADAAGGLPISDAGGLDLDAKIGALTYTVANKVDANVTHNAGSAITSSSGRQEVNLSHIAGSAVSTSTAQLGVNVVNFGGSAGTFASGRPEVNTSHIAGNSTAASNVNVVYNTDFATNYDTTNDRWTVNVKTWNNLTTVALPLIPTIAGMTLDVNANGNAGIDWGNVDAQSTAVVLSGTTVNSLTNLSSNIITADAIHENTGLKPYTGTLDAGGSDTSFILGVGASTANNYYRGWRIHGFDINGTTDVVAVVTAYNGLNRLLTFAPAFDGLGATGGESFSLVPLARVSLGMIQDDEQSATDLKDFADSGYDPSTNKVQGVVLVDTVTTYTGNTPQTGDSYAIVNSGTHGNAAIKGFVDDIGVAGAGLSNVPWNASWDAEVQSEVQDAIEANNLDHLVKIAVDTDFATTVHANSVVGHLADNGAGFDRTTDSLEAMRDNGDSAWITNTAASIRSAVGLASANLDTQLDALPTNSELATAIITGLTTALTEGYRSTNSTGSVRDLLYELLANITEFTISGTTKTAKRLDGSTTAKTYTLNDATTPTGITETT